MRAKSRLPLGNLLVQEGVITPNQLLDALLEQQEKGGLLGEVLVRLKLITDESVIFKVVARQQGVEYVQVSALEIPSTVLDLIPAKLANHYRVLPISHDQNALTVAISNVLNVQALDDLEVVTSIRIRPALANDKEIMEAIGKYYGVGAETIEGMVDSAVPSELVEDGLVERIEELHSEASISKFINQMLLQAYKDRVTDIHIEPFEGQLQIRNRVDGVLYDVKLPDNIKMFQDSLLARIKIMSNLNIAEKRLPQDGRFKTRVAEQDFDLRVSFVPTPFGESCVLRILNSLKLFSFEELGFEKDELKHLDYLLERPYGIVFVTGPTGSGKTTTLYSCLSRVNKEDAKIITIEDPIEYQVRGITQIQVHSQIGLTFAAGLRSMLRQDPDIMMVGEVRDLETAEVTIHAALTGHLVFSTLHTNDSASAVTRLLDMGTESFLIASAVECFIAQRLVRTLCPECKKSGAVLTSEMIKEFGITPQQAEGKTFYQSVGCKACRMTGFKGRAAICEFLMMTEPIKELVLKRASASEIKNKAMELGMQTMRQHGFKKVLQGKTTPEEVLRATHDD